MVYHVRIVMKHSAKSTTLLDDVRGSQLPGQSTPEWSARRPQSATADQAIGRLGGEDTLTDPLREGAQLFPQELFG